MIELLRLPAQFSPKKGGPILNKRFAKINPFSLLPNLTLFWKAGSIDRIGCFGLEYESAPVDKFAPNAPLGTDFLPPWSRPIIFSRPDTKSR